MGCGSEVNLDSSSVASNISSQISSNLSNCAASVLSAKNNFISSVYVDEKGNLTFVIDGGVHEYEEAGTQHHYVNRQADRFPA